MVSAVGDPDLRCSAGGPAAGREPWEDSPVGSASGPTLLELIAGGDVDAAAGFYDGRAPNVRAYFTQLCTPELVDEATLAAFIDFRGRAASVPPGADADEILSRAARTAAAGRLELRDPPSPECRATAELLWRAGTES
jgi:hypothetical protein